MLKSITHKIRSCQENEKKNIFVIMPKAINYKIFIDPKKERASNNYKT